MDPRVRFESKEESNDRREREFLALPAHERFLWFLRSFDRVRRQVANGAPAPDNFVIHRRGDDVRR